MLIENTSISKLVFLSTEYKLPHIPFKIRQYVPYYELLEALSKYGLVGGSEYKELPYERLKELYQQGKDALSDSSQQDLISLLSVHITQQITDAQLPPDKKLELYGVVSAFSSGSTSLIAYEDTDFTYTEKDEISLLEFGFEPLDKITQGFIPGTLFLFSGASGTGKTSIMLRTANNLAQLHSKRVVWVSLEMTAQGVKFRSRYLNLQKNKENRILTSVSFESIKDYADNNTILVVDYPDLMLGNAQDERLAISNIYSALTGLSKKCFMLIVASQINRTSDSISLNSLMGSGAKGFYPEMIIALYRGGKNLRHPGYDNVTLHCIKHRFGVSDVRCNFPFNYATLDYLDIETEEAQMYVDIDELFNG